MNLAKMYFSMEWIITPGKRSYILNEKKGSTKEEQFSVLLS
jgi:hypothetical protein